MNTLSQVESLQPAREESRSFRDQNQGLLTRSLLMRTWSVFKWLVLRVKAQQARKNLRVCETVSLGEKRFVAVVQVDEERFLIGGSSGAVSLLTRLQEGKTFARALDQETAKIL